METQTVEKHDMSINTFAKSKTVTATCRML